MNQEIDKLSMIIMFGWHRYRNRETIARQANASIVHFGHFYKNHKLKNFRIILRKTRLWYGTC